VVRRTVITALGALALLACGGEPRPAWSPSGRHDATTPTVARRRLDDRPPLVLVRREGDPAYAVAFAAAHDFGPLASTALAAALEARLVARGFAARGRPTALGFGVTVLVPSAGEARRLVQALSAALAEPFGPAEPALGAMRAAVQALGAARLAGPAEEATAACAGEPFLREAPRGFDPAQDRTKADIDAWREAVHTVRASALAAVGSREVLAAVEDALARGPAWPEGAAANDPWPARDELGVDFGTAASHRLSLAVRTGSEDSAARAVAVLGSPESTLARRLAALRPEWRLERATAVGRPRGACVRLEAVPVHGDVSPAAPDVARALGVLTDELGQATHAAGRGELDDAILSATDPGEAAAAAAWRVLVGREAPGPERSFVAYGASASEKGHFDLSGALTAAREAAAQPLLDVARRAEPGQGRVWALLAPTCGTSGEAASDAGEAALVVSALARAGRHGDVTVEPWIATDGVGLLVGARRLDPDERPEQQARRLGLALGELITTVRPTPAELVAARDELATAVGGDAHRGYYAALEALSAGHPSWLEPRGTFAALSSAPAGGFDSALGRWLARPLKLAVLANGDPSQADVVRLELERWLRPVRGEFLRCPGHARAASAGSEVTLSVTGDTPEGSYVGVPFPAFDHRLPSEARATLFLFNRTGGWLDQALADLSASATALALGGPDQAALVVQVVAAEGQRQAAVERLRALFERVALGKVTAAELDLARHELEREDASAALDPRRRVIATWRGAPATEPALDGARLARWLSGLRRSATVVVNVAPRG
jgi:hypothetical protein